MTVAAEVTEVDVLKAAIKQFKKSNGFVVYSYYKYQHGTDPDEDVPTANVTATCAIGGIEHAIWRLTGDDVSGSRANSAYDRSRARVGTKGLYTQVMRRLNRTARDLFPVDPEGGMKIFTIEGITFWGAPDDARKRVLKVCRKALRELA